MILLNNPDLHGAVWQSSNPLVNQVLAEESWQNDRRKIKSFVLTGVALGTSSCRNAPGNLNPAPSLWQ